MDATPEEKELHHEENLQCAHCNAALPLYALFCGICGESLYASISEPPHIGDASGTSGTVPTGSQGGFLAEMQEVGTEGETQLIYDPEEDTSPRLPYLQPSGVESCISNTRVSLGLLWSWQVIIVLSAVAAALFAFVFSDSPLRSIFVMWFLFICPGMMLVGFLRLNQPIVEWVLALSLSLAIDAIVSGIVLYVGNWSPSAILSIIIDLTLAGAIMHLTISNQKSA